MPGAGALPRLTRWTDATARWRDETDLLPYGHAKRRRPSKYATGYQAFSGLVPVSREYDPYRWIAILDAPVAHGLSVIGLLPWWHQN